MSKRKEMVLLVKVRVPENYGPWYVDKMMRTMIRRFYRWAMPRWPDSGITILKIDVLYDGGVKLPQPKQKTIKFAGVRVTMSEASP